MQTLNHNISDLDRFLEVSNWEIIILDLFTSIEIDKNTTVLFHGIAKDYLEQLSENTIDLVVTSPPYFVGKEYDTSKSVKDFSKELQSVLPPLIRALKSGGNLCFQVGNHVQDGQLTPLDAVIFSEILKHPELILRNRIIWTFGHGAHASKRFSGRHETVLWYSKGNANNFDLDAVRVPQLYPGKRHYKGPKKGEWSANPLGKNPGDVWDIGDVWGIPNVKAHHIEKTDHPCQFPIALARRLIAALCPKDGLVVDPYLGSGTTAVAAMMEERNASGCDLELKYLKIAKKRLGQLRDGSLKFREDTPARSPKLSEAVSKRPPHFPILESLRR